MNLDELREMTEGLPDLSTLVKSRSPGLIRYDLVRGDCTGSCLLFEDAVAAQSAFIRSGSVFPTHVHDEHEHLICYEGSFTVACGGEVVELKPGYGIHIEPGTEHSVTALENSRLVGIIVPGSKDYPSA